MIAPAVLAVFTVVAVYLTSFSVSVNRRSPRVSCLYLVLSSCAAVSVRYHRIRFTFSFHRGDATLASRRVSAAWRPLRLIVTAEPLRLSRTLVDLQRECSQTPPTQDCRENSVSRWTGTSLLVIQDMNKLAI